MLIPVITYTRALSHQTFFFLSLFKLIRQKTACYRVTAKHSILDVVVKVIAHRRLLPKTQNKHLLERIHLHIYDYMLFNNMLQETTLQVNNSILEQAPKKKKCCGI